MTDEWSFEANLDRGHLPTGEPLEALYGAGWWSDEQPPPDCPPVVQCCVCGGQAYDLGDGKIDCENCGKITVPETHPDDWHEIMAIVATDQHRGRQYECPICKRRFWSVWGNARKHWMRHSIVDRIMAMYRETFKQVMDDTAPERFTAYEKWAERSGLVGREEEEACAS